MISSFKKPKPSTLSSSSVYLCSFFIARSPPFVLLQLNPLSFKIQNQILQGDLENSWENLVQDQSILHWVIKFVTLVDVLMLLGENWCCTLLAPKGLKQSFNPFLHNRMNSSDWKGSAEKWSACICMSLGYPVVTQSRKRTTYIGDNLLCEWANWVKFSIFYWHQQHANSNNGNGINSQGRGH